MNQNNIDPEGVAGDNPILVPVAPVEAIDAAIAAFMQNENDIENHQHAGINWPVIKELRRFGSASTGTNNKIKDFLPVTKCGSNLSITEAVTWYMDKLKSAATTIGISEFLLGELYVPVEIENRTLYEERAREFFMEKVRRIWEDEVIPARASVVAKTVIWNEKMLLPYITDAQVRKRQTETGDAQKALDIAISKESDAVKKLKAMHEQILVVAVKRWEDDNEALSRLKRAIGGFRKYAVEQLKEVGEEHWSAIEICADRSFTRKNCPGKVYAQPLTHGEIDGIWINLQADYQDASFLRVLNMLISVTKYGESTKDSLGIFKIVESVITQDDSWMSQAYARKITSFTLEEVSALGLIHALPQSVVHEFTRENHAWEESVIASCGGDKVKLDLTMQQHPIRIRIRSFLSKMMKDEKHRMLRHSGDPVLGAEDAFYKTDQQVRNLNKIVIKSAKSVASVELNPVGTSPSGGKPNGLCFSWLKNGTCARGTTCYFRHESEPSAVKANGQAKASTPSTAITPTKQQECKWFAMEGGCRKGDKCPNKASHTADRAYKESSSKKKQSALVNLMNGKNKKQKKGDTVEDGESSDSNAVDCVIVCNIEKHNESIDKSKVQLAWDSGASITCTSDISFIENPKKLPESATATGLGGKREITHAGTSKTFDGLSMKFIKDGNTPNLLSLAGSLTVKKKGDKKKICYTLCYCWTTN